MNKKLVKEFLIITFVIMLIFWGGCALISQIFNLSINYICLFNYLFISSQMSAKPYFIGSTGILPLW